MDVWLWDGATYVYVDTTFVSSLLSWHPVDATSIFTTLTQIQATRLKLVLHGSVGNETIIYTAKLIVEGNTEYVDYYLEITKDAGITLTGSYPYLNDSIVNSITCNADDQIIEYFTFSKTMYAGGPYVSLGTINDYGSPIGPINIPYSRLTDALDLIMAEMITATFVPWEWWFDYTGALQVAQTRGADKSASVTLEAAIHIGRATKASSSRQTSQRVRTVGRGESAEQDRNTSYWWGNTNEMANVGTFYEKLDVEKEISDKDKADVWSQIVLAQEAPLRQEITVVLENDQYTVNDFDVGDTVTVKDPDVNLSGKYRVKTIEKSVVGGSGETTTVTLSNVRTDISDKLANFAKTLEKMQHSSTYIDVMYAEGSRQQQLNANAIEDVWEQTASNKFAIELPEDEANDANLDSCKWTDPDPAVTEVKFRCDKDEFEIWSSAVGSYGNVWLREPLVKFSRNPRFTCEFSINTTETNSGGTMTEWAYGDPPYTDEGDLISIRISSRGSLCGGADPNNPNKYCCLQKGYGFGFQIIRTIQGYMLRAHVHDNINDSTITIAKIDHDIKFTIEARMEWTEKVVKFYFGKTDVESSDLEWGFRLRAILPISPHAEDSDDLCPFFAELVSYPLAKSLASKQCLYIYRWKTQAIRAVKE